MYTDRIKQNAQKFAYLIKAYPEKTVPDVISLFQMGPIDINTAIWAAIDLGYIADMDQETRRTSIKQLPKTWDFGQEEADLQFALEYAFTKINAEEKDMEENYLNNWVGGYPAEDALIAMKRLLETGVLHEYQIEDGDNAYIFYTLKKNAGKNWGTKQFKENPLTGEDQVEREVAEPDAPATEE